jgi:hypothetical protein
MPLVQKKQDENAPPSVLAPGLPLRKIFLTAAGAIRTAFVGYLSAVQKSLPAWIGTTHIVSRELNQIEISAISVPRTRVTGQNDQCQ